MVNNIQNLEQECLKNKDDFFNKIIENKKQFDFTKFIAFIEDWQGKFEMYDLPYNPSEQFLKSNIYAKIKILDRQSMLYKEEIFLSQTYSHGGGYYDNYYFFDRLFHFLFHLATSKIYLISDYKPINERLNEIFVLTNENLELFFS